MIEITGEQKREYLNYLVDLFIRKNLNLNTVLDKISENGIFSLTNRKGKKILSFT